MLIVALDQCTKALVRRAAVLARYQQLPLLHVRYQINRKAFSGPLSNRVFLFSFLAAEFVWLAAVLLLIQPPDGILVGAALGIAAGGASSNVIDQVVHQGVVDFIDLGWWPVFNLADVAIVLGAASALACFGSELVKARIGAF